MKIAVIVFPGSNCDHDVYYVFKKILEQETDFVWHKENNLVAYDVIILPGGFSYGDYLRCGAISRFSPVMKSVIEKAKMGTKIIGICNGFQILTESGLLPGALIKNENRKFVCKNVYLKTNNTDTVFTNYVEKNSVIEIPIAHGEGNYYCDAATLEELQNNGQIVFQYCDEKGKITTESNPSGSVNNIAGIINRRGNILGMMPHPERNSEKLLGNGNGLKILKSMIRNFAEN